MQDISFAPNKVLSSLIYGLFFHVIMYMSYKLSEMAWFLLLKLIGIFGTVWFLWTYAKNI